MINPLHDDQISEAAQGATWCILSWYLSRNAAFKTCYVNEKLAERVIGRRFVINGLIFLLNMLQI